MMHETGMADRDISGTGVLIHSKHVGVWRRCEPSVESSVSGGGMAVGGLVAGPVRCWSLVKTIESGRLCFWICFVKGILNPLFQVRLVVDLPWEV